MPVTIWHDAKRVAICTTPKVACTELLEYVRWVEAGPALACPFVNHSVLIGGGRWESYVKSAERECALQKDQPLPAPHGPFTYTPIGQVRFTFSLAIAPSGWRVLIPFRDPWKRLVSGFRDKYLSESHGNETLFAQQWMQQDSRCSERRALVDPKVPCPYFNHAWVRGQPPKIGRSSPLNNALVRFMVQLLPFPHGGNGVADDHFRQQAVQCLAPYASAHLAPAGVDGVPIDQENALDSVSSALGHASDGLSFSQVMTGAYKPSATPTAI